MSKKDGELLFGSVDVSQSLTSIETILQNSPKCNILAKNTYSCTEKKVSLVPYELESDDESTNKSDVSQRPPSENKTDMESNNDIENLAITVEEEANHQEEINKTRKRKKQADDKDWTHIKNKKLRMEGKAYLGFTKEGVKIKQNRPRQERKLKLTCNSPVCKSSKKRFCLQFSEECRNKIFTKFWGDMSWE